MTSGPFIEDTGWLQRANAVVGHARPGRNIMASNINRTTTYDVTVCDIRICLQVVTDFNAGSMGAIGFGRCFAGTRSGVHALNKLHVNRRCVGGLSVFTAANLDSS